MEAENRTMKARREGLFVINASDLLALILNASSHTAYKAKGALKQDDLRRRREEQQVEIRRQKRDENIAKRRNFLPSAGADSDEEVGGGVWDPPVSSPPYTSHMSEFTKFVISSWPMRWYLVSSLTIQIGS